MSGANGAVRIGILGGSFDPPHLAHRALAQAALDGLALDSVLWLPARAPWQKAHRALADADDRLAMVRLLIADEPAFVADERELRRSGPTYTLDTVRELCAERPEVDWHLVIGQDQYGRFDTWQGWRELLARVRLAVAARAGEAPQPPAAVAAVPHRFHRLDLPRMDIAASEIRARCAAGQDITELVGRPVARYIDQHALYTGRPRS